jgi:modulator of FtsH protease HflK
MTGMSNDPQTPASAPAPTPQDAGSQALAEALRSSFAIVKFVMILLVLAFFGSGLFTVGPQQKAIILRFGKPVGEGDRALLGAGLHWSFPPPIDEILRVPITELQTVKSSAGWYAMTREEEVAFHGTGAEPLPTGPLNPAADSYALTADGNIVHVRATLSYRIDDPLHCVFGFAGAANSSQVLAGVSNAVQNVLDNALLYAAAHYKVDDLLVRDALGFQDAIRRHAAQMIEQQQLGVVIEQCYVENRRPPRQLDEAFRSVVTANEHRNTALNGARSYANRVLFQASADAAARTNTAAVERTNLVASVAAEAARFQELLPQYERSPALFIQQHLVEALGRVLANAQEKEILPTTPSGKPVELRLLLNRELPKPKTEGQGQ